ncbi:hypothetical protein WMF31_23810 [Sorangium sp. So ce1036]|uniref:hypothetical protein n=1 Tax=Sorangium sp. So ce1036 TaxID=3133328 RepID=UPI003F059B13
MRRKLGSLLFLAAHLSGCALAADDSGDPSEEVAGVEQLLTRVYYVSNPTSRCSSALRLTATGANLTSIQPSSPNEPMDSLFSPGTGYLVDTWYVGGWGASKDYSYATACADLGTVTVHVTGGAVDRLRYWFTDCPCEGYD